MPSAMNPGSKLPAMTKRFLRGSLLALVPLLALATAGQAAVTLSLSSSENPIAFGNDLALFAEVPDGSPADPIAFFDGATQLGSVPAGPYGIVKSIAAGYDHTCALLLTGGVECWGNNSHGQIGDGTSAMKGLPTPVVGLSSGVIAIAAGNGFSCAVLGDGGVRCWGRNDTGTLGDLTLTDRLTPVAVQFPVQAKINKLAAGADHICGLTRDSEVWCWGSNMHGQRGQGNVHFYASPSQPYSPGSNVVEISSGGNRSCALSAEGGVRCWGQAPVGDWTYFDRWVPTNVYGLTQGVKALASSRAVNCVILSDGTVKCWGDNSFGGVGTGTTGGKFLVPTAVAGITSALGVSTGGDRACALLSGGALNCWGKNASGELGDGSSVSRASPVAILASGATLPSLGDAADAAHACMVSPSGRLQCWGSNASGQLGDGTLRSQNTPTGVVAYERFGAKFGPVHLSVGAHTLTASYQGAQSNNLPATVSKQVVDLAFVGLLDAPIVLGNDIDLKVATEPPTVVGSVAFFDGTTSLGTAQIVGGVATLSAVKLEPAGNHDLSARFIGSEGYEVQGDEHQSVSVGKAKVHIYQSTDPESVYYGDPVTRTIKIVPETDTKLLPTGYIGYYKSTSNFVYKYPIQDGLYTDNNYCEEPSVYTGDSNFLGTSSRFDWDQNCIANLIPIQLTISVPKGTEYPGTLFPRVPYKVTATVKPGIATSFQPKGVVVITNGSNLADVRKIGITPGKNSTFYSFDAGYYHYGAHFEPAEPIPFDYGYSHGFSVTVTAKQGDVTDVNTSKAGIQTQPNLAPLASGNFIAVWESNGVDGTSLGIFGQVFAPDGSKVGGEIPLVPATSGRQLQPHVAGLKYGGFVLTWQSIASGSSDGDVVAQMFKANGAKNGAQIAVHLALAGNQAEPLICATADGGFIVVWSSSKPGTRATSVIAKRFDSKGKPLNKGVQLSDPSASIRSQLAIAKLDGDAGYIVGWQSRSRADQFEGLFAKLMLKDGSLSDKAIVLVKRSAGPASQLALAPIHGGGFVAAWVGPRPGAPKRTNLYGAQYASNLSLLKSFAFSNEFIQNQFGPALVADPDGGFVLIWTKRSDFEYHTEVYLQRYNANHLPILGREEIYSFFELISAQLLALNANSYVAALKSFTPLPAATGNIYLQRFGFRAADPAVGSAGAEWSLQP